MEFKGNPNLEQLSSHLAGESPRCAVIVSAAYFDVTLANMLGDAKDRSFYARIDDGLAWGLLAPSEHRALHVIRELRNSFAHDPRVTNFDNDASAKVASIDIWTTASDAKGLSRVIQTPLQQLLFVVGVIAFRLQKRIRPPAKNGPLPEPSITDWAAWPPVTSV